MGEFIKNKWIVGIFLIIVLLSLAGRFYDLTKDGFRMDLYGTSPGDEGGNTNSARNKVLFGDWKLDGDLFNIMYHSPMLTFFEYVSFSILGVSTFSARIMPSILGIIAILLASFLIFLKNRKLGIIYFILLSINTFLIAYSRTATSESITVFFILIILGLIIYNKRYTWILAGVLTPFLFFSKSVSLFFILAIPISLFLYYWLYKDKRFLIKLYSFTIGLVFSGVPWLLWLIPRLNDWLFMNLGTGRLSFTLTKPIGALYGISQFSVKIPIISILVLASLFFTLRLLIRKEKVKFVDFFLIVSLILFYLQILFLDFPLRRFVMLMPILLLISARFISKLGEFNFNLDNKLFKINRVNIMLLIVLIYAFINIAQLGEFFYESYLDYDRAHSRIKVSKEIGDYIPSGSRVFGTEATLYSLENGIRPYRSLKEGKFVEFVDYENYTLTLLTKYNISYVMLPVNLFDENEMKLVGKDRVFFTKPKVFDYIKNNFKIIAVLNMRNTYTNYGNENIYIYQKINSDLPNNNKIK